MTQNQSANIKEYYDSAAATYGNSGNETYPSFLKHKLIRELVQPGFRCLDIGVATGLHALPLARASKAVYGLDLSNKMLEQAERAANQQGVRNLHLMQASGSNLPLMGESFELVYSFSTIIFVPEPERAIREAYRMLKPGGLALLDITGTFNLSQVYWTRYYRKRGHKELSHYSLDDICQLLKQVGFEILESHSTGLMDQWKYIPLVRHMVFLNSIFHNKKGKPDLDYWFSQRLPKLANRWYFVLKKSPVEKTQ